MTVTFIRYGVMAALVAASAAGAGCGELSRQGTAPAQVIVYRLQAANGNKPDALGGSLLSDVITNVKRTVNGQQVDVPTIFNDVASVTMGLVLRDPGTPAAPSSPSALNQITFTRYRIVYRRGDGRNTPGVDVPYPWDGATTFTVTQDGTVTAGFEIVRHAAKEEAPLMALRFSPTIITTIAELTFYGRDQAGNEVQASAAIQIDFGNFGDPE